MNKIDLNYDGEFGPEMQLVIPYAYYLYKHDLLGKTVSSLDTKAFYYFSQNHEEKYSHRMYRHPNAPPRSFLPNPNEHVFRLNTSKWIPPPYKSKYANKRFKWNKQPLIITNKLCLEWGGPPVNYIDLPVLEKIIRLLKNEYQLIYCRLRTEDIINDDNESIDFSDSDLIKHFPEVLTIQELHRNNQDLSFNNLQLMLYANCNKFISVQGGNSVLASYFGGVNVIYVVKGHELMCGDYNHFSLYSKAHICPCVNYNSLLDCIRKIYAFKGSVQLSVYQVQRIEFIQFIKYNILTLAKRIKAKIKKILAHVPILYQKVPPY